MINSKLILILKSFTKKEIKDFTLFLNSALFNKNTEVTQLYQLLKKYYPHFDNKLITHEALSEKITGKRNIKKLRYIMTDLTKLAEKFIAFKHFNSTLNHNSQHLLSAYQERNLFKYFHEELQKNHHQLNNVSSVRNDSYYKYTHEMSELAYIVSHKNTTRNTDTELQHLSDHLDLYYLTKKLKYSSEIINRMNILKTNHNIEFLEKLLPIIETDSIKNNPVIKVYLLVLKTLRFPENEKTYHLLRAAINKNINYFSSEEQYDLYGYLQNYCIKKINSGKNNYLMLLFENYTEMISNKVIIKDNQITQFDFKNIITVALRVEKYDWANNFIHEFKSFLPEKERTNAIAYNQARIEFYKKNYSIGLKTLLSVEFTDVFYSLDSRVLILKTYYELEDYEAALSLINSFKIYLKRDKKISDFQNSTYSGFIKIFNLLIRYKLGYLNDLNYIENELENIKQIADSTWLNQKIEALKKSNNV